MSGDQSLTTRRSTRYDVVLNGQVSVAPADAGLVRLSASSGAKDGWIDVSVIDVSWGGLGFVTSVFFPRRTVLHIRLSGADNAAPPLVEAAVRVQRVVMTDRRPAYLFGAAFDSLSDEQRARVEALLAALEGEDQPG